MSGCWRLAPGRVVSLHPCEDGELQITQGRVWATLDVTHSGHGNELGDHFLHSGHRLPVRAGQHLVVEAYDKTPVCFEWASISLARIEGSSRWSQEVKQPCRDMTLGLAMAGSALVRLVIGLAGYGEYLVAGRGRVMSELEANPP